MGQFSMKIMPLTGSVLGGNQQPGHKVFPYLLLKLSITRPNQVWAMDITYIPKAEGFIYLAPVVDWFTCRVLAWRVSITLEFHLLNESESPLKPQSRESHTRRPDESQVTESRKKETSSRIRVVRGNRKRGTQ